jgi:3-oxoacyl-[acyl-carrier protein] reductase
LNNFVHFIFNLGGVNMDLGIKGKWALVGGASKGLGWGCARALALEGVNVVMVARGAEALNQSVADLQKEAPGVKLIGVAADITTEAGRAALFSAPGGPGKDFDIVVTNAGGPPPGDFRNWDREAWIKAVDANMLTPIELIKATVDGMAARGFGRIVNITSSSVKSPIDILGLSNGARSGLTGFVAGVARTKIAAQGVTINNILPGKFDTDRIRTTVEATAQKTGKTVEEVRAQQQALVPAGRYGTPQEFGALCAFICSQQASYITGQNLLTDGGAYPGTY